MGGEEKLEKNLGGEMNGLPYGCGESAQGEVWLDSSVAKMGGRVDWMVMPSNKEKTGLGVR